MLAPQAADSLVRRGLGFGAGGGRDVECAFGGAVLRRLHDKRDPW